MPAPADPWAEGRSVTAPAPPRGEASNAGLNRDREATAFAHMAFVLALSLTGQREEARDVAQDAMVRLFGNAATLRDHSDVRPWLLTTVRNLVRDRWRRGRLRPTDSIDAVGVVDELRAPADDPEQALTRRRAQERVWRALSSLSAEKREILVLRDFHDLPYAEIATVLGIPTGTVMSRLHAARTALGAALQRSTGHA